MTIEEVLVKFGTEAVQEYCKRCLPENDNEIPESEIRDYLLPRLRREFNVVAQKEFLYLDILERHFGKKRAFFVDQMGLWKADIALFPEKLPPVMIELKKVHEPGPLHKVLEDIEKLRVLQKLGPLDAYIGAMICDTGKTGKKSVTHLIAELESHLAKKVETGSRQKSLNGEWEWSFVAVQLPVS